VPEAREVREVDRIAGLTLGACVFFILGLAVGTVASAGDTLAFWTAGLMVATAVLAVFAAHQAALSTRLQAEQTRPFLVWDSYEHDTGKSLYAVIVRNIGRVPARVLTVECDGSPYAGSDLGNRQVGPQSKHLLLRIPDTWPGPRAKTVVRVKYSGVRPDVYALEDDIATIFVTCGLLSDLQRGRSLASSDPRQPGPPLK
jgi:hypothetical protein